MPQEPVRIWGELHRHLITDKGCAERIGSVVTSLELTPTVRPYRHLYGYCLWFTGGACGDCIDHCPPGAISFDGKDKQACRNYLFTEIMQRYKPGYGCGKCRSTRPARRQIRRNRF